MKDSSSTRGVRNSAITSAFSWLNCANFGHGTEICDLLFESPDSHPGGEPIPHAFRFARDPLQGTGAILAGIIATISGGKVS